MKKQVLSVVYAIMVSFSVIANAYLTDGLDSYAKGDFSSSVLYFQRALDSSGGLNEDAQYWLTMALASDKKYNQALSEAKRFLTIYPKSSKAQDMLYQRGRLECSIGDYEASISTLYDFIQAYPNNTSIASAYFWIGEALYNSSRLSEARTLFSVVVLDYPNSAKVEAAKYKLALIDRASTQEELLRLLKLSNDETLRLSQELEKLKAQSTQPVIQNNVISDEKDIERISELEKLILDERRKNTELYDKITLLQMKNDELSTMIANYISANYTPTYDNIGETLPPTTTTPPSSSTTTPPSTTTVPPTSSTTPIIPNPVVVEPLPITPEVTQPGTQPNTQADTPQPGNQGQEPPVIETQPVQPTEPETPTEPVQTGPTEEEIKRRLALEELLRKAQILQGLYDEVLDQNENE